VAQGPSIKRVRQFFRTPPVCLKRHGKLAGAAMASSSRASRSACSIASPSKEYQQNQGRLRAVSSCRLSPHQSKCDRPGGLTRIGISRGIKTQEFSRKRVSPKRNLGRDAWCFATNDTVIGAPSMENSDRPGSSSSTNRFIKALRCMAGSARYAAALSNVRKVGEGLGVLPAGRRKCLGQSCLGPCRHRLLALSGGCRKQSRS